MIKRAVLPCGQSLRMPLVAASPEQSPGLRVGQATTWQEASRLLAECTPDVLILDLTAICRSRVLPLLLENPHLVLIGLDTEWNQARLLSGQEALSLPLEGLRDIVYGRKKG